MITMETVETSHAHVPLTTPTAERPLVIPKIVTVSSPEEQHLPYRVDIDLHKTGAFMRSLGMTDKQIQDTTLTIAYETRGLAKLGKPLDPLGYVNTLNGNLTINAHSIIERAQSANALFLDDLEHGVTKEQLEFERTIRRLSRRIVGQIFPELTEPGQSESMRSLNPLWRTKYANLARERGQQERAKRFMESHVIKIMDHNLRLTLPHELIHTEQVKSGRHWRMVARAIPTAAIGAGVMIAIDFGVLALSTLAPAMSGVFGIAGLAAQAGVAVRTVREGRRATGIEKEAYERMKLYDESFTNIVRLTPMVIRN